MISLSEELGGLFAPLAEDFAALRRIRAANDRSDALSSLVRGALKRSSLVRVYGDLHRFDGRCHVKVAHADLARAVRNALSELGVPDSDVKRMGDMPLDVVWGRDADPSGMLCFTNGVLDVASGKFVGEFSPDVVTTERLDYAYDPSALCPLWDSFLAEVLPDPQVRTRLIEFFALSYVDRSRLSVEKFAIFRGSGANGKSVVFEVMKRVMGDDNVETMDPRQLTDEKMIPYVRGLRLNFAPDVRKSSDFDSALKALSSGQEVTGRRIYGDAEKVKCPPLVFSVNEMPLFRDTTEAFFRRVMLFTFPVTIPAERQDRSLASRICATELPGIFSALMRARSALIRRGGEFSPCPRMDAEVRELRNEAVAESNPVVACLAEMGYSPKPLYKGQAPEKIAASQILLRVPYLKSTAVTRRLNELGVESVRSGERHFFLYPMKQDKL